MAPVKQKTIYWLDHEDKIVRVGPGWDEFALDNDGRGVVSAEVVGCALWDFVTGETTQMWIESLLGFVRVMEREITRPYRCDSPMVRRYMKMTVTPVPGGLLRLEHLVSRIEPRPHPVHMLAAGTLRHAHSLRCSNCGKIRVDGQWVEAEINAADTAGGTVANPLRVLYAICEDCLQVLPSVG